MSKARAKGTFAESMVVRYLQSTYWPYAERRALSGGQDKGDITGTPGLAWEVKSAKTLCVPAWLRETEAERVNAKADYATLVIKPTGVGAANVGQFYALMATEIFDQIPWSAAPDSYTFSTTIRKMSLKDALGTVFGYSTGRPTPWRWVNYPGFVLTNLNTMCALLNRAGYGSENN